MKDKVGCVVCGFYKKTHKHHIIKMRNNGSDNEDNLVELCPNHHWIADFGDDIWDDDWWKDYRKSFNYSLMSLWLRGRGITYQQSKMLNIKAEKLILIKKLKESLPNI